MKHVIVGSGPAGIAAARTLRRIAPGDRVLVVAEEHQPFYSKVLTSYFVAGAVPYDTLLLFSADQLHQLGIEFLAGSRAVKVDPVRQAVLLTDGETIEYDRLLLATGASPTMPPIDGTKLSGVFALSTHDDAVGLANWITKGQRALVMGAGLVGLKAAEALLARGLSVTVVEMLDRVLPQLLAQQESRLVRSTLQRKGLNLLTNTTVMALAGAGRVEHALLGDGAALDCDVVAIATGVRPDLSLARTAGIACGRGILVDELMRSSVPGIFAAGDVAEGWDLVRGRKLPNPTWGNATEQGRVAAHNMVGHAKRFNGAVSMTTFTFRGFNLATVGITRHEGEHVAVQTYNNPTTGDYRKLVLLGDRLIGAIALGDISPVGIWRGLIAARAPIGSLAGRLLPGRTTYARTHNLAC